MNTSTEDPFAFLPPTARASLGDAGRTRRREIGESLARRVAQRGRRRQRVRNGVSLAAVTLVALFLWRPWTAPVAPIDPKVGSVAIVEHLPTRAQPWIETVQPHANVVARMRTNAARHRVVELSDDELGSWLRAAGVRPARIVIDGKSTVLDLREAQADD